MAARPDRAQLKHSSRTPQASQTSIATRRGALRRRTRMRRGRPDSHRLNYCPGEIPPPGSETMPTAAVPQSPPRRCCHADSRRTATIPPARRQAKEPIDSPHPPSKSQTEGVLATSGTTMSPVREQKKQRWRGPPQSLESIAPAKMLAPLPGREQPVPCRGILAESERNGLSPESNATQPIKVSRWRATEQPILQATRRRITRLQPTCQTRGLSASPGRRPSSALAIGNAAASPNAKPQATPGQSPEDVRTSD